MSDKLIARLQKFSFGMASPEDKLQTATISLQYQRLVRYLDDILPENQEKTLAVEAVENSYLLALRSLAVQKLKESP